MSELFGDKKALLKELIKALHLGADPEMLKERFRTLLGEVGATEIAQAEQELIEEGMSPEEVRRLCDVHLAVMQEAVEKEGPGVSPGHPIYILLKEHEFMKDAARQLKVAIDLLRDAKDLDAAHVPLAETKNLLAHFQEYNKHKVREENCLFPYLEKHGVSQPPAIMWMEHDQQREAVRDALHTLEDRNTLAFEEFKAALLAHLNALAEGVPSHFYKEENILFPTSLKLFSSDDWKQVKASMDDLGYCDFTPEEAIGEMVALKAKGVEGQVSFPSGALTSEQLQWMLNSLPVDITFVDANNEVRYFSMTPDRIFPRTPAIIGRSVQQCHPQKSVHVVNQIVEDFRAGRRENADFWIRMNDRLILIRYFPVRNEGGKYLGCVEVTQDITDIQKITGEKRLLD